jgi:adenine-specific DNA methylase
MAGWTLKRIKCKNCGCITFVSENWQDVVGQYCAVCMKFPTEEAIRDSELQPLRIAVRKALMNGRDSTIND